MNKYKYYAQIINDETDEVLVEISSDTQEGLEEEMGKSKWEGAIDRAIQEEIEEQEALEEEFNK